MPCQWRSTAFPFRRETGKGKKGVDERHTSDEARLFPSPVKRGKVPEGRMGASRRRALAVPKTWQERAHRRHCCIQRKPAPIRLRHFLA